jgi:hypothetical protein
VEDPANATPGTSIRARRAIASTRFMASSLE